MIAPNEPQRNDPCPCGSGLKHKHCCLNPQVKARNDDYLRVRVLAHLFLTQLQALTGAQAVALPRDALATYPEWPKIKVTFDKVTRVFQFQAVPNEPQDEETNLVVPSRRIVAPRLRIITED